MGSCQPKQEEVQISSGSEWITLVVSRGNFIFMHVIGRGGFGKVWRVERKKDKITFAMKQMSKARIIAKRSISSVMNERKLLARLRHPFLINMNYAFQDRDNLYLVTDLLTGGDLRYHIGKKKKFSEVQAKFIIACIIIGLEYLHNNGIIHRDIKPENLVLEGKGYVRLTDLGVARVWYPENAQDTSGTPGYMAPQVMSRQNHGVAADYYAVGVIGFELMTGKVGTIHSQRPYTGRTRKDIKEAVFQKQVQLKKSDIPEGWSIEAADFINRLIQRKPQNRLGLNGPQEIKQHAWLKSFKWQELYEKRLQAPFIPNMKDDNFDSKQVNKDPWKEENRDVLQQNSLLLRRNSIQSLFNGYYFDFQKKIQRFKKNFEMPDPYKVAELEKVAGIGHHPEDQDAPAGPHEDQSEYHD